MIWCMLSIGSYCFNLFSHCALEKFFSPCKIESISRALQLLDIWVEDFHSLDSLIEPREENQEWCFSSFEELATACSSTVYKKAGTGFHPSLLTTLAVGIQSNSMIYHVYNVLPFTWLGS